MRRRKRVNAEMTDKDWLKLILILLLFSLLVFAVVKAATKPTPVATSQQVEKLLTSKGYTVRDLTEKYKVSGSSVTQNVTVEQGTLVFQFFVFEDGNSSKDGYDKLTTEMNKRRTRTQDVETKGFHGNFIYRTLLANGKYYCLSRIGETLIYATGTENDREAINEIMFELGYLE